MQVDEIDGVLQVIGHRLGNIYEKEVKSFDKDEYIVLAMGIERKEDARDMVFYKANPVVGELVTDRLPVHSTEDVVDALRDRASMLHSAMTVFYRDEGLSYVSDRKYRMDVQEAVMHSCNDCTQLAGFEPFTNEQARQVADWTTDRYRSENLFTDGYLKFGAAFDSLNEKAREKVKGIEEHRESGFVDKNGFYTAVVFSARGREPSACYDVYVHDPHEDRCSDMSDANLPDMDTLGVWAFTSSDFVEEFIDLTAIDMKSLCDGLRELKSPSNELDCLREASIWAYQPIAVEKIDIERPNGELLVPEGFLQNVCFSEGYDKTYETFFQREIEEAQFSVTKATCEAWNRSDKTNVTVQDFVFVDKSDYEDAYEVYENFVPYKDTDKHILMESVKFPSVTLQKLPVKEGVQWYSVKMDTDKATRCFYTENEEDYSKGWEPSEPAPDAKAIFAKNVKEFVYWNGLEVPEIYGLARTGDNSPKQERDWLVAGKLEEVVPEVDMSELFAKHQRGRGELGSR